MAMLMPGEMCSWEKEKQAIRNEPYKPVIIFTQTDTIERQTSEEHILTYLQKQHRDTQIRQTKNTFNCQSH